MSSTSTAGVGLMSTTASASVPMRSVDSHVSVANGNVVSTATPLVQMTRSSPSAAPVITHACSASSRTRRFIGSAGMLALIRPRSGCRCC
jgi:hypothetical protein